MKKIDEAERSQNQERAKIFLEFWEHEIKQLMQRSDISRDTKEIFFMPLFKNPPELNPFAAIHIVNEYLEKYQDKTKSYRMEMLKLEANFERETHDSRAINSIQDNTFSSKVDSIYKKLEGQFYPNTKVNENPSYMKNYVIRWVNKSYKEEDILTWFKASLERGHVLATDIGASKQQLDFKFELPTILKWTDHGLETGEEAVIGQGNKTFVKNDVSNTMKENTQQAKMNRHEEIDKKVDEFMEKNTKTVERWRSLPKEDLVRKLCLNVINKNECAMALKSTMYRHLGVSRPIKQDNREGLQKVEGNNKPQRIQVA